MATQISSSQGSGTLTVVEVLEGAFNFPRPSRENTLRLRLRLSNNQSPDEIEREASEALEKLLNDLGKALEKNSEDLGVFLKSLVPRREEFSTDGAYEQALQNFKNAMPILRAMMQEQSAFTTELLDKVKAYLIESWKMLCNGASDEDMRVFREKHREEACRQFEDRAREIKEKMKLEATKVSGTAGSHGQYLQRQHSQGQHPRDDGPWKGTPMDDTPHNTSRDKYQGH